LRAIGEVVARFVWVGEEVADATVQVVADGGDQVRCLDHHRHVVDEVDQHHQPGDREQQRDGHRQVRDGADVAAADDPEHEQGVQERGDERAQHDLVPPVAHEVRQQSRAELARRQGQRHDRDREDDAGDRDHRAGDH
jgi:hypothetical protein